MLFLYSGCFAVTATRRTEKSATIMICLSFVVYYSGTSQADGGWFSLNWMTALTERHQWPYGSIIISPCGHLVVWSSLSHTLTHPPLFWKHACMSYTNTHEYSHKGVSSYTWARTKTHAYTLILFLPLGGMHTQLDKCARLKTYIVTYITYVTKNVILKGSKGEILKECFEEWKICDYLLTVMLFQPVCCTIGLHFIGTIFNIWII